MINKTPTNLDKFPVPVSGQKIPGGWFARLVSFINSLVLHGDGQYLTVKHTQAGQTIAPTPALLQALGNGGAPPAAGGGSTGSAGFPNYLSGLIGPVTLGTTYSYTFPVWIIGEVYANTSGSLFGVPYLNPGYMADIPQGSGLFICMPIPANTSILFNESPSGSLYTANLNIFKCA